VHWSDRSFFALAVVFYGLSVLYAIFLRREGFRRDDWFNYGLLAGGAVLHTIAMLKRGFSLDRCPITNLYEATGFITWTIVAGYLLLGLLPRLRFLGAFAAPLLFCLGVFALMPALDTHGPRPDFTGGWASMHKTLILLAYGSFGVSAASGLMYLTQEYDLKHAKMRAVLSRLPSIQRLEVNIGRAMLIGAGLLTAGLMLGTAYLKQKRGVYLSGDPEVVYSFVLWLIYLALLIAHFRFAQRGRRFAWSAVGSFVFVMLTFWGVYMLSGIHNPPKDQGPPKARLEVRTPPVGVDAGPGNPSFVFRLS
jgi:ABC-type uncharacterized transport system permease subunit